MNKRWACLLLLFAQGLLSACIVAQIATDVPTATPVAAPTLPPTATLSSTVTAPAPVTVTAPVTSTTVVDGLMVQVNGHQLALYCMGTGTPTVILEAGLGGDHQSWAWVQPPVARLTRVCSYDRAGLGASDPGPKPRTGLTVAQELHQLLRTAGEAGPYVLVGHSFGGLFTRLYAHHYPDAVIGMVLVDAVHEDWWRRAQALLPPPTPTDSPRLQNFRHFMTVGYADPAQNVEGIDIPATVAAVHDAGALGDLPLLVLVAGIPTVLAPGLPPALETDLNHLLQVELPTELAHLSTFSIQLPVSDSGHDIPREQPDAVVVAIRTLLDVVRLH
ncbi:MAG: alpha/beta hydrolase [Caldilineaceae bacterium]